MERRTLAERNSIVLPGTRTQSLEWAEHWQVGYVGVGNVISKYGNGEEASGRNTTKGLKSGVISHRFAIHTSDLTQEPAVRRFGALVGRGGHPTSGSVPEGGQRRIYFS